MQHTACCMLSMTCNVLHPLLLLALAMVSSSAHMLQEFAEIHSNAAHLQLESFYIGKLAEKPLTQQASACMPSRCTPPCCSVYTNAKRCAAIDAHVCGGTAAVLKAAGGKGPSER